MGGCVLEPAGGGEWRCFLSSEPAGTPASHSVRVTHRKIELHVINIRIRPLVTVFFTISLFPVRGDVQS